MTTGTQPATQFNVQAVAPAHNPPNVANPQNQGGGGGRSGNIGGVLSTPFNLTPRGSNRGIIDYASKNGFNHWKGATANI